MEDLSEQEKWEYVQAWLRVNVPWIVAGVALAALGIAGFRWWQARNERLELQAAASYQEVLRQFNLGNRSRADYLADQLERDFPRSPYAAQADLAVARVLVDANELDAAAARLGWVVEHSRDPELASVARLRLARVQIAQGKPDAALATLAKPQSGAFAASDHEARGDAYYAKGQRAAALEEYRAAALASGPQRAQNDELNLKINDLMTEGPAGPATAPGRTSAPAPAPRAQSAGGAPR